MCYFNKKNVFLLGGKRLRLRKNFNVFFFILELDRGKVSYRCCCRRLVWKWCEIFELEIEIGKFFYLFLGIRFYFFNIVLDFYLYKYFWGEENKLI